MKIKKIKKEIESMYVFNGSKFAEYINMDVFKTRIRKELDLDYQSETLAEVYSKVTLEHPEKKPDLDKIFFECILYNYTKHVFIHKFSDKLTVRQFKMKVKKLIENLNKKDTIPEIFHSLMSENGFYLMDKLNISTLTTKFIAGFDFEIDDKNELVNARFLFTEVVPRGDKKEYFIAGIDIDFKNNTYLIMVKSKLDISKLENEQANSKLDRTIHSLYYRAKETVISNLLRTYIMDVAADRSGMYNLCRYLDNELLKDIRKDVKDKTENNITSSVSDYLNSLFPSGKKPSPVDRKELEENIQSLLIGIFIKTNYKSIDLVKKAKRLKLLGYPTKIKYVSNRANKGATQSPSSKHPMSGTDIFHNLYISFRDALALEQWSICWFTDYTFSDEKDLDYIQTTIYTKSTNFEVVFLATRPLSKEDIFHVVSNLNRYREKKDR